MKRIIAAFLAAVTVSALATMSVFAESAEKSSDNATYCFDNGNSLNQWNTYGSVKSTGLKLDISDKNKESGDGSLCISENIASDIPSDEQYGGAYITAESLGLEDFKGCTVQMSVLFDENAVEAADKFTVFSDGIVWISTDVSSDTAGQWTKASLTVPENAANSKIGFVIPVFTKYSGNVAYIDNVIIYDAEGNIVANTGDYALTSKGIEVSVGLGGRIVLTIVLVLLIVGVIGGIGLIISKSFRRFTR